MGIEIIRLGDRRDQIEGGHKLEDLAPLTFQTHRVVNPPMSIWMMSAQTQKPILPWWNYDARIDDDINKLNKDWTITSSQSLFDCLYLSQLKKTAGSNFYVIFPGNLKTEGWDKLQESDQLAYGRGQSCVYHLEGAFNGRLAINWVPFFQPQSIVKDPGFGNLWRMFVAARTDDVANSISFFSLSDHKLLPKVIQLLIHQDEQRSETLARLVDWFGMYSSPVDEHHAACGVVYAGESRNLTRFADFERQFQVTMDLTRQQLLTQATPQTAFKILSRNVAL